MKFTTTFSDILKSLSGRDRNAEIVEKVYEAVQEAGQQTAPEQAATETPAVTVPEEPLSGLAGQIKAASASLTNPDMRVELPEGFPPLLNGSDAKELLEALRVELAKHGTTLDEVGHINVAYPHKHPGLFPGHSNSAASVTEGVVSKLKQEQPGVDWLPVDGLVERVKLGRSEDQTSVHALTARQEYDIDPGSQKTPLPFVATQDGKKEFFIVVDTGAEQGTTYANMVSYILHNGGAVLAAVSTYTPGANLRQVAPDDDADLRKRANLKPEFNDAARNTGQLARMALAFADSARVSGKDWTPAECLEMFESKLRTLGNSVFAMTNGEAERIVKTVDGTYYRPATFVSILEQLDSKIEAKTAAPHPAQPKARAHTNSLG